MADDVGSIAAMRVALQTLSDRCEKLQSRLDIVEKENVTIKGRCTCQAIDNQSVQVNLQELSCKKQQLVEYLRIVTDENCTLWTKLSSLDKPAVHLNDKIKPKNSIAIIDNYLKYNDADLKINSNCIMDTDDNLVSLQYSSDDESWPMLLSELNAYKEKLTFAKHLLANQNDLIINITSKFNLLVEEVKLVKPTVECRDAETLTISTSDSNQPCICGIRAKPDNHSICPLCKLYIVEDEEGDGMFDKLVEHVSSHFPSEEPETIIDSLSGHY
ncbi:Hypothetical protein CINCED_3A022961 [Cinara cedri]|uniref:Uncharacterized protein n=1 Tax=Cinara cedri TaxID=506608 RepID=A0A5E4M0D5_9HEMI|nr:Hypothetical protein CINCED_3A022961 [Cinara cedri]